MRLVTTGIKDQEIIDNVIYPDIQITFPIDEKKIEELGGQMAKDSNIDDWIECRSDESNKSDFEYKYEDGDADNMIVKKFKKSKMAGGEGELSSNIILKEPICFKESIKYNEVVQASQTF